MSANSSALECQPYFTHGDPLTHLLKGHLQLSPWLGTIVCGVLINLPLVAIASANDLWFDRNGLPGLLNDYGWWALQLTMTLPTFFFFLWAPDGICSVLRGLVANRAIVIPETDTDNSLSEFVHRFDQRYSYWVWVAVSFIFAVGFMNVIVPIHHRAFRNMVALNEVAFWYTEFFWFIMSLLVALLVIRAVIVVLWFNRLFKEFRVDVKPLHKDGAGGLAPLGNFSAKIGYLIGIYGIAIAVIVLAQSYWLTGQFGKLVLTTQVWVTLLGYLVLSPLAFFAPISTAHSAMQKARNDFIQHINEHLESNLAKIRLSLDLDAVELKASLDKIEQLQRVPNLALRFPVWPLNTQNLVRFFSSVLSPIAFALAPSVGGLLVKFINW